MQKMCKGEDTGQTRRCAKEKMERHQQRKPGSPVSLTKPDSPVSLTKPDSPVSSTKPDSPVSLTKSGSPGVSLHMRTLLSERPFQCVISEVYSPALVHSGIEKWMMITRVGLADCKGKHRWNDCKGKAFERVAELLQSSAGQVELELVALDGRTVTHTHRDWSLQIGLLTKECALYNIDEQYCWHTPVHRRRNHVSASKSVHIDGKPFINSPVFSLPTFSPSQAVAIGSTMNGDFQSAYDDELQLYGNSPELEDIFHLEVDSSECLLSPDQCSETSVGRLEDWRADAVWHTARPLVEKDTPYMSAEGDEAVEPEDFALDVDEYQSEAQDSSSHRTPQRSVSMWRLTA